MCKAECIHKYYPNEIKSLTNPYENEIQIVIVHGQYPDIFVRYISQMSLIGFLCNFGGLLGMWLGQSLFDIFIYIFNKLTNADYQDHAKLIYLKLYRLINVKYNFAFSNRFISLYTDKKISWYTIYQE